MVRARLSDAVKEAGLSNVRLHDFRRTAITLLAASGAPATVIQQFVGHSSIEMAMRYVKSVNEPVQQARVDVADTVKRMMDGQPEAREQVGAAMAGSVGGWGFGERGRGGRGRGLI